MKRLVASMLSVAVAICFSVSTGCTPKTTEKFSVSPTSVTLEGKDKDAAATAKNGEIKEIKADKDGIIEGKYDKEKITFKALKDATGEDQKVEFTITPKTGDAVKVTAIISKKKEAGEVDKKKPAEEDKKKPAEEDKKKKAD